MRIVRGTDERLDGAAAERFELRRYTRVFLPLRAASEDLGTLELGYAAGARARLGEESKRTFAAFADQVAIAVHNMQLLRRTDEALARKMAELAVGQEIQLSLLPKACPEWPGWEFCRVLQRGPHRRRRLLRLLRAGRQAAAARPGDRGRGRQGGARRALHGAQPDDHPHDRVQRPQPRVRPDARQRSSS